MLCPSEYLTHSPGFVYRQDGANELSLNVIAFREYCVKCGFGVAKWRRIC